jgi:uncharacterized protein (TIGR03663 family)
MELFLEKQKKRLYIYLIIAILAIGIAFRAYDTTIRPIFTDEGVHYAFIFDLWKNDAYRPGELFSFSSYNSLNDTLNIYTAVADSLRDKKDLWDISDSKYQPYFYFPASWDAINYFVQPYFYLKHVINNSSYKYDPVYHGPFLYYLGDLVFTLAGDHSLFLLRLPIVITSILAMFFVFLFKDYLGRFGLVLSITLIVFSPGLIYFSNLANYENYFAVFSMLGVGLLLLGIRKRNPWIMCLSGIVLLTLITIKETALVTWFCIVIATILTYIVLFIKRRPSENLKKIEDIIAQTLNGEHNDAILKYLIPAVLCFIVGGIVFVLLYSSFGGNMQGIHDGLTSWMYWKNTGAQSGHIKTFSYFTELPLAYDFMITFFFFTGTLITLFSTRDRYKIFLSFWAILVWLVYSVIPYKTPWLEINFLIPFAISAGIGWNIIYQNLNNKVYKYIAVFIILLLTINATDTAIRLKWFDYDKPTNRLAYVHPYRDFEEEVKAIRSLLLASPDQYRTEISIAVPEYWPLPAYLLGYPAMGYFGGVRGRDLNLNAPIIINDTRDNPELRELLLESDINDYVKLRDFKVRPGVTHSIFISQGLLDNYLKTKYYEILIKPGSKNLFEETPWD